MCICMWMFGAIPGREPLMQCIYIIGECVYIYEKRRRVALYTARASGSQD